MLLMDNSVAVLTDERFEALQIAVHVGSFFGRAFGAGFFFVFFFTLVPSRQFVCGPKQSATAVRSHAA